MAYRSASTLYVMTVKLEGCEVDGLPSTGSSWRLGGAGMAATRCDMVTVCGASRFCPARASCGTTWEEDFQQAP